MKTNMYHVDPNDRILLPRFQEELYRRIGNAIIKKVIDERDKAYEVFLEYRWKMKEAELNSLVEEGLISKEELEAEM